MFIVEKFTFTILKVSQLKIGSCFCYNLSNYLRLKVSVISQSINKIEPAPYHYHTNILQLSSRFNLARSSSWKGLIK